MLLLELAHIMHNEFTPPFQPNETIFRTLIGNTAEVIGITDLDGEVIVSVKDFGLGIPANKMQFYLNSFITLMAASKILFPA